MPMRTDHNGRTTRSTSRRARAGCVSILAEPTVHRRRTRPARSLPAGALYRQTDVECGSFADIAFEEQRTAMAFDDRLARERKPLPRADADGLGGEERFE